jgi:hypothetical protein
MGRHSAPEDDAQDSSVAVATNVDVAPRLGRLARPDARGDGPAGAPPIGEQVTERLQPGESAPPTARGNQSTAADLALLRAYSDVRARVVAAVVAPFVLYTVILYLAGGFGVYLLWAWIPLVTAGIVAGSILDAAHRKRGTS